MTLHQLRLHAFRAHARSDFTFAPKVNLIWGANGIGKTNVLEALHYLCLTKSFLVSQDSYVLRKGSSFFEVEGQFEGVRRSALRVKLVYTQEGEKRAFVNGAPMERLSDIVGMLPIVVCAPSDQVLTAGEPEERRRFLSNILSQARPRHLDDLMRYRRVLLQRNELLRQARQRRTPIPTQVLESWNAELVLFGSRIIAARQQFLHEFSRFMEEAYARIASVAEQPTFTYETITPLEDGAEEAQIAARYADLLAGMERREKETGRTLIGPHRDELIFRLNSFEVRRYASQGQHRTFGLALKLAQYFYLYDRLEEPPILLLDDVFDNLDDRRTRVFVEMLTTDALGQSLITSARPEPFTDLVDFSTPQHQLLHLKAFSK
jgi:DNA replication and repair protein RecF